MNPTKFDGVNWKELGMRCGIEIHQQVLTERKLFCRCPAGQYTDHHHAKVLRHMRPTLSELGEYDGTALMEFKTKKNIVYLLNRHSVCTYEMDDTPPFEINRDAVDGAIEIAVAFGCKIVGEMHVIRKQYLDGSIPTGFQRTMIIGVDGKIDIDGKIYNILQVNLEEDSCREISDRGHDIVFRTDRLSMPLVEIITGPEIYTPEEAGRVVRALGRTMRATGRVRRGAGAVRQDVNVSVAGGCRVEIKGVPSIGVIPGLVGTEALRQRDLLRLKDWYIKTYGEDGHPEFRTFDADSIFTNDGHELFASTLADGGTVGCVHIPGFAEALTSEIGPHRTLADDIAGRVRVIACIDERPIMIHGGNREDLGIDSALWKSVRRRARAKSGDAIVLLRGSKADVETGLKEVIARVREVAAGVPDETRQVDVHGSTDFERVLPGPNRMYPDTDSPPMMIGEDWLEDVMSRQIEPVAERESRLTAQGLTPDMVDDLAIASPLLALYDRAVEAGADAKRAGHLLTVALKAMRRSGVDTTSLQKPVVLEFFRGVSAGRFNAEVLPLLVSDSLASPESTADELIGAWGFKPLSGKALSEAVSGVIARVEAPKTELPEARVRYYMGELMPTFLGNARGSDVEQLVKKAQGVS